MLNKVILQGRLVANPEIRQTQSATVVASFRIACDRSYKSKDQNAQNTDFINVVAWRSTAEFISCYFTKGSMILVDGRLQVRSYQDNNGQNRYVTEVVAESVNFCGSRQDSNGNNQNNTAQQTSGNQQGNYRQSGYAGTQAYTQQQSFGGYPAQQYAAPAGYGPNAYAQAPANEFAELADDDGELPF